MDRRAEKKRAMRILSIETLYENVYASDHVCPRAVEIDSVKLY
jgi:hypothetical protein